jgi:hypothetical protein
LAGSHHSYSGSFKLPAAVDSARQGWLLDWRQPEPALSAATADPLGLDARCFLQRLHWIHLIEGEALTPMLLARRFTLNPVLVIISLVFWFWMWGIPGTILSMPMLAVAKIICDRVRPLAALGHFLEA